jgi:FixJ family two-component response regulator
LHAARNRSGPISPWQDVIRSRIATLTPRERQVFEMIVRGNSNKAVANAFGSAERTVKAQRRRLMEKLQLRTLAELVSFAERVGVASVEEKRADEFAQKAVRK